MISLTPAIPTSAAALLRVQELTLSYNGNAIVEQLSFTLAAGQIACLLGASGSGKTTVLRAIAGFEPVRAGEIVLAGDCISSANTHRPAHLRRIGMVFQDHALFPHLTVAENIGFGLQEQSRAARQQIIAEMLALVGLNDLDERYPHELSGGQQQRVALARALAPSPQLLLLDEPFANLDVELRERLGLEVRQLLKARNVAAILVTHDQHEAFAIADEIGVLHNGRLSQWATPYQLYHEPNNRYVAGFVGEGVLVPGKVVRRDWVEIELGCVNAGLPIACAIGDAVEVLLRPDDILHDDGSTLTAKVVAKAFRGAEFLYTLELPSGQRVLSLVPSHHNHAIGEAIGIRLELDHAISFPPLVATD